MLRTKRTIVYRVMRRYISWESHDFDFDVGNINYCQVGKLLELNMMETIRGSFALFNTFSYPSLSGIGI